jgi:hypothetical protein
LWYNKAAKHMRYFACTFDNILIRFFLMAAFISGGQLSGQPLITILALPLFFSVLLGISFMPEETATDNGKQLNMLPELRETRKAA